MVITIDGPAASGKSTVAREIAKKLGFHYLSSGMLYRSLAYILLDYFGYSLETLYNVHDPDITDALDPAHFACLIDENEEVIVTFDAEPLNKKLKTSVISQAASIIALNPQARKALLTIQKSLASKYNIVIEGRDIGSHVFPHADVKFFLTASLDTRALRWQHEQEGYGIKISFEAAKEQLSQRDERDRNRSISPLIIPQGAIIIDNTSLNIEQTVEFMLEKISHK